MAILDDSYGLVRSLLDDVPEDVETDTRLLAAANSAYRRLQRKLASNGCKVMQAETDLALAAAATSITSATSPALPSDFMWPRRLREYITGQLATTMTEMRQVDELPARDQTDALQEWEYRDTGIFLVGSPLAVTVRLRYEQFLTPLTVPADTLLILGCEDALAYRIAAHLARSRGQQDVWNTYTAEAHELEADLINNNTVRVAQNVARRPRGYNNF